MAAEYVIHQTNSASSAASLAVTITGVTAGDSIFIVVTSSDNFNRTYTATDDVDAGAYTVDIHQAHTNGRTVTILHFANCTGGDTQVTVTPSVTDGNWSITPIQVTGVGATPTVTSDGFNNVAGTTHYASAASGFSPPADSLIIAGITFNATPTAITAGSGYTGMYNSAAHPSGISQYRETASLLTDHRPECTTTSSARLGPGACVYVEADGGGGGPAIPIFDKHYRQMRQ